MIVEPNAPKPSAGLKKLMEEVLSWPKAPVPEAGELLLKGEEEAVDVCSFCPNGDGDLLSTGRNGMDSGDDGGDAGVIAVVIRFGVDGCSTSFVSPLTSMSPKTDWPEANAEPPPNAFPPLLALPPRVGLFSELAMFSLLASPKTDLVSDIAPKASRVPPDAQAGLESPPLDEAAEAKEVGPL